MMLYLTAKDGSRLCAMLQSSMETQNVNQIKQLDMLLSVLSSRAC